MTDLPREPDVNDVLRSLRDAGYDGDFHIAEAGDGLLGVLVCQSCGRQAEPSRFKVEEQYRFEGTSNPDDMSILIAGPCPACGQRGLFMSAFGAEVSPAEAAVLRSLPHTTTVGPSSARKQQADP